MERTSAAVETMGSPSGNGGDSERHGRAQCLQRRSAVQQAGEGGDRTGAQTADRQAAAEAIELALQRRARRRLVLEQTAHRGRLGGRAGGDHHARP